MLAGGMQRVYDTLDLIDDTLLTRNSPRISQLVELANLSTIVGNLLASGVVAESGGVFERAGAHKYQDLRASLSHPEAQNIEIKMALETNNPKGHLPKEGHYLTCRYVLGNADGTYVRGKRGEVVWIWEVRFGYLELRHFNVSNTEGDSGKTAVVNAEGLKQLSLIYLDQSRCPYSENGAWMKSHCVDIGM
jgi:hypothetical protein